MAASDQQVQVFADTRIRPHAELVRQLLNSFNDDIGAIDDIYTALNIAQPTWSDQRTDGPPHLLVPSDVLAINQFMHDIATAISTHGQFPIVQKACVRAVGS